MTRIVIKEHIKPNEEVWTGIPGKYKTAPAEPGLYSFVEYAKESKAQLTHVRFTFEKEN